MNKLLRTIFSGNSPSRSGQIKSASRWLMALGCFFFFASGAQAQPGTSISIGGACFSPNPLVLPFHSNQNGKPAYLVSGVTIDGNGGQQVVVIWDPVTLGGIWVVQFNGQTHYYNTSNTANPNSTNIDTWTHAMQGGAPSCLGSATVEGDGTIGGGGGGAPEIDIEGNSTSIADGDTSPDAGDHTDFGNVAIGGSQSRTFTLQNEGTADLTLSGGPNFVSLTGSSLFSITSQPTSPIAGPGSTTFQVQFNANCPSAAGAYTATVSVSSDDADESPYTFQIRATITGTDTDSDGALDLCDTDDDNDGVLDATDPDDTNFNICGDTDADGCDDCSVTNDGFGPLSDSDPANDGTDTDGDGLCDSGDPDDDNDGCLDGVDPAPLVASADGDTDTYGADCDCDDGTNTVNPGATEITCNGIDDDCNPATLDNPSSPDIVRGNILNFDGTDDGVDMGNPANFNITANITLEAWVYSTNTTGDQKIITKFGDVALDNAYALQTVNGEPQFYLDLGAGWQVCGAGTTLSANTWYHIAGTYDGTNMKIYVNGVERNSIAQTGAIDVSASTFKIGTWAGGNFWTGQLDEVRVWNTARTANEVRESMHLTLSGCETGLVSYYQFNEGAGTTLGDNAGSANNGTIAGAATWNASAVNVGNDASTNSNSQTLNVPAGPSTQTFAAANAVIRFFNHSAVEDVTVTYQAFTPNTTTGADGITILSNPMWTVNKSSASATMLVDYTFTFPAATFTSLEPAKYSLYWRPMNAHGNWTKIATAHSVTATTAGFGKINLGGQFMVVQESQDLVSDVRGNMYTISENSELISVPGIDLSNSSFTIELWAKRASTTTEDHFFGQGIAVNNQGLHARYNTNGTISFAFYNDDFITGPQPAATDGAWHHLAFVYNSVTLEREIFVDGVSIGTNNAVANFAGAAGMNIGAHIPPGVSANNSMDGNIDEFRIWNAVRSRDQIRENMHLTLKGNEANLLAYYQFNNDDAPGTANGVKDASVNGNHGTTQNLTAADYIPSEVAVAGGTSDRVTVVGGSQNFPNTGVNIEFGTNHPNGEIVVYRLETEKPHGWASIGGDVDNEYFVVENFGTQTFDPLVDITFNRMNYISPSDVGVAQASSPLEIYKRDDNAFGATWGTSLGGADNATSGSNASVGYNTTNAINSFSQIVIVNTSNNSDLPVEMVSFKADRRNVDEVELNWITATETNNHGYEIERMFDNETTFSIINFVEGQGTTTNTTNYQYVDNNSYSGVTYYRLKQMDNDGTFTYSEVRAVTGKANQNTNYIDVSIYPNPVYDELKVRFNELPQDVTSATVQIVNINGQIVQEFNAGLQSHQVLEIEEVKHLAPAMYLLSIRMNNGEQILQKFVKE